jgi:hypothetical protein
VGDGRTTLFWQDRWLLGQRRVDLAPRAVALVPKRIAKRRTVAEALENSRWINDFRGGGSWDVSVDFLTLWEAIFGFVLQPGIPDKNFLRLSNCGQYSSKMAYDLLFSGSTFGPFERLWHSWAPAKCCFFL